jgi:hypothetical protein
MANKLVVGRVSHVTGKVGYLNRVRLERGL